MRSNERALRRTNREITSDRRFLEAKEKELELEIKKLAKQGQKEAYTILAKQLLKLRKQKAKSCSMTATINAMNVRNRELFSMTRMTDAMGKTTNTMKTIASHLPPDKSARNLQEFVKTQEHLSIKNEMVSDALDTLLDDSGDDVEEDRIVNQVLEEIGIDLNAQVKFLSEVILSDDDLESMLKDS
ncbi:unnamed protein product [Thelazia callipaeda]|uniref:Charged multivesicular body protein 2b n=1 Tax=Thelazia callipaeda TaxID=103827 RepID=A0A0N5D629_THECL|nr:unnamed protein product [Thelazia callipaeda]